MTDQPSKDDTTMAVLCYVLAIFTGFIGPLIIWLIKKDQSPFVNEQGKEVLNWEITAFLAMIACLVLAFVVIGFFLMPLVWIANLVFLIMGAVKVGKGESYRFPFALRLLR
ncbi:MAG: DUF4870 domain-containing protein [Phycisphaerales bacterium]